MYTPWHMVSARPNKASTRAVNRFPHSAQQYRVVARVAHAGELALRCSMWQHDWLCKMQHTRELCSAGSPSVPVLHSSFEAGDGAVAFVWRGALPAPRAVPSTRPAAEVAKASAHVAMLMGSIQPPPSSAGLVQHVSEYAPCSEWRVFAQLSYPLFYISAHKSMTALQACGAGCNSLIMNGSRQAMCTTAHSSWPVLSRRAARERSAPRLAASCGQCHAAGQSFLAGLA